MAMRKSSGSLSGAARASGWADQAGPADWVGPAGVGVVPRILLGSEVVPALPRRRGATTAAATPAIRRRTAAMRRVLLRALGFELVLSGAGAGRGASCCASMSGLGGGA